MESTQAELLNSATSSEVIATGATWGFTAKITRSASRTASLLSVVAFTP